MGYIVSAHVFHSIKYFGNESGPMFMQKHATVISIFPTFPEKEILGYTS